MNHYEKYEELVTKKKLLKVTCDRCDEELPDLKSFDYCDFSFEFSKGKSYPDNTYGNGWKVEDLCDECVEFLKNLLIQHDFRITDFDW